MIKLLFLFLILFCNIANASLPESQNDEPQIEINYAESVVIDGNAVNTMLGADNNNDDDGIHSVALRRIPKYNYICCCNEYTRLIKFL